MENANYIVYQLNEAARYSSNPKEAIRVLENVITCLAGWLAEDKHPDTVMRIFANLTFAKKYIQVEREVFICYCKAAAFEVQVLAGK